MHLGELEFIYQNDLEKKKNVGMIQGIEVKSVVYFSLTVHRQNYWCILHKMFENWQIDIPTKKISIELSHLEDTFWNSERLIEELGDYEAGIAISSAVKELYRQRRDAFK